VIGVGNSLRGDDAAGLEVARALRAAADPAAGFTVREHEGETLALLDAWQDARAALVVDAVSSGAPAGTIHRADATSEPLPARLHGSTSTHAVGLADTVELARALGRLPARIVLFGVEGRRFASGSALSGPVADAIPRLVEAVLAEARALGG